MNRNGPIIIIEDDANDQLLLKQVFQRLNYTNQVFYFSDAGEALTFLESTTMMPLLVLSDIDIPKLDEFALRHKVTGETGIHMKCIPYVFFSASLTREMVIDAYSSSVQGLFIKEQSMLEMERTIVLIMNYWQRCATPNNF